MPELKKKKAERINHYCNTYDPLIYLSQSIKVRWADGCSGFCNMKQIRVCLPMHGWHFNQYQPPHPWISLLFREGSPVPIYTDGLKHCRSKVSRLRTHQSDLASAWTKLPDPGSRTSPIIEYWINSPDYCNAWWRLPLTAAAYKLCPLFRNKLACKYNINETVSQAPL